MIKRIPVTPDPDGRLRVICGEDILEVTVVPPQDLRNFRFAAPDTSIPRNQGPPPEIWRNPNDETIMLARPASLDAGAASVVIAALEQVRQNPAISNPKTLVVGVKGIDLHGAVHFASRMTQQFPDTAFSIDLGLSRGPYG